MFDVRKPVLILVAAFVFGMTTELGAAPGSSGPESGKDVARSEPVPDARTAARLFAAIEQPVKRKGGSIERDPVLSNVAEGIARALPAPDAEVSEGDRSVAQVRDVLWTQGLADEQVIYAAMTVSAERTPEMLAEVLLARPGINWASYNLAGTSVLDNGDGTRRVAVVAVRRLVELSGELGERFEFRVREGFERPWIVATRPDGAVADGAIVDLGEGRFEAVVPVSLAGLYKVELLVEGPWGPEVALLFPYRNGSSRNVGILKSFDPVADVPVQERVLLMVNAERARIEARPLKENKAATSVAVFHAREILEQGFAHRLGSGDPADRMRTAGIPFALVSENLALADSVEEAHLLLMASPAHRRNILDPKVTHAGVAVIEESERYPGKVLVVQIFYRAVEFEKKADLDARAERIVARTRAGHSLPVLDRRIRLNEAAWKRLAGAIDAGDPKADLPEARKVLEELRFHYGGTGDVTSHLLVAESVEALAQAAPLMNPEIVEYGLAVEQPEVPGNPYNGLVWICIVTAEREYGP